jgi:hypothetical protein
MPVRLKRPNSKDLALKPWKRCGGAARPFYRLGEAGSSSDRSLRDPSAGEEIPPFADPSLSRSNVTPELHRWPCSPLRPKPFLSRDKVAAVLHVQPVGIGPVLVDAAPGIGPIVVDLTAEHVAADAPHGLVLTKTGATTSHRVTARGGEISLLPTVFGIPYPSNRSWIRSRIWECTRSRLHGQKSPNGFVGRVAMSLISMVSSSRSSSRTSVLGFTFGNCCGLGQTTLYHLKAGWPVTTCANRCAPSNSMCCAWTGVRP